MTRTDLLNFCLRFCLAPVLLGFRYSEPLVEQLNSRNPTIDELEGGRYSPGNDPVGVRMLLEGRYSDDRELLKYYKQKLLEPGWAGDLDKAELAYVRARLGESPSLRRRWGFRPSAKRLSTAHIRRVAMYGVRGDGGQVLASPKKNRLRGPMGNTRATPKATPVDTKSAHPGSSKGKFRPHPGSSSGQQSDDSSKNNNSNWAR